MPAVIIAMAYGNTPKLRAPLRVEPLIADAGAPPGIAIGVWLGPEGNIELRNLCRAEPTCPPCTF
jgi:hypothetical protein